MKLRRSKQGLQSQSFGRKNRRSRSYGCPYCGKMFFFQSHLKLHMKGHSAEPANLDTDAERDFNTSSSSWHILKKSKIRMSFLAGSATRNCLYDWIRRPWESLQVCYRLPILRTSILQHSRQERPRSSLQVQEADLPWVYAHFKSSFSIWRHQVEVHNQNMMSVKEKLTLGLQESNHDESSNVLGVPPSHESISDSREEGVYSDSSVPPMYDSEDSSSYVPEDLSAHGQGELQVKEEPQEEAVSAKDGMSTASVGSEEPGVWPCEKCGKLFSTHKDLERHQELLCHIKPFICHICHKAFRTNFRLWSHYQSHMSTPEEPGMRDIDRLQSSPSPSPPLTISFPEPPTSPLKASHSGMDAPGEEPRGSMSPSTKQETRSRQNRRRWA